MGKPEKQVEEDSQEAGKWSSRLARAVIAALRRYGPKLDGEVVHCLVFDIHPWNGFLNLSIRVVDDAEPLRDEYGHVLLADWRHAQFAIAHEDESSDRAWSEARTLASTMEQEFYALQSANPDLSDEDVARRFYARCRSVAEDGRVWTALRGFDCAADLSIVVVNVDYPSQSFLICNGELVGTFDPGSPD